MARIYCPRCEPLAINGTPCHEDGCPNQNQKWESRGRGDNKHCIPANEETPEWLKPNKERKRVRYTTLTGAKTSPS